MSSQECENKIEQSFADLVDALHQMPKTYDYEKYAEGYKELLREMHQDLIKYSGRYGLK